jgi:hypothetical protein
MGLALGILFMALFAQIGSGFFRNYSRNVVIFYPMVRPITCDDHLKPICNRLWKEPNGIRHGNSNEQILIPQHLRRFWVVWI